MGRKVHPTSFRLGIIKDWQSRWYADRNYADLVLEDIRIRKTVGQRLTGAGLSKIEIQRSANQIEVTLHTAKPGVVIGKGGTAVDLLRKDLETMTGKKVKINIEEVKQPELDAYLVAESIAEQISRRVSYRRAMKQSVLRAQRSGAKGVRVRISGRLGGAEMARSVWEREGRVPLHTIRADIDYGQVHAHTTYGRIGVKVWIYKGDVIERKGGDSLLQQDRPLATAQPRPDRRDRPDRPPRRDERGDGPGRNDRGDRGPRGGGGGDRGGRGGRNDAPTFRGGTSPQFGGAARNPDARGPRPERQVPRTDAPVQEAPAPAPETTTNEGGAE
ncbi:MAG: small subunit ribosomal protein [Chloroflexia bacterium]|jgi:small subunit ribosomal protein S3|nr:small subunit ribosomal protein [Chloroflexia bacterium]